MVWGLCMQIMRAGVALPVLVAVDILPGVSLFLVAPGVVWILGVVPVRYGSAYSTAGNALVGCSVECVACALVVCSRHYPMWWLDCAYVGCGWLWEKEILFLVGEVVISLR